MCPLYSDILDIVNDYRREFEALELREFREYESQLETELSCHHHCDREEISAEMNTYQVLTTNGIRPKVRHVILLCELFDFFETDDRACGWHNGLKPPAQ